MFKYKPCKSANVDRLYCLLCTTIIASNEGYSANKVRTELEKRTGIVAQFYRAYYARIAGEYSIQENRTVNVMTLEEFNTEFYDAVKLKYDAVNGVDAYNRLPEIMQFEEIFKSALLPTVGKAVSERLLREGYTQEEVDKNRKIFYNDFLMKFRYTMDEFLILNSTPSQLWVALSNFAIDMPHVVIGFRKQISSYDPTFFRENKDNLDSVIPYMKSKKLKFANYTGGLSIAGVIIGAFVNYHYVDKWMGEYAGTISSGSGTYVDADGVLLYGSELQEKMFNNVHVSNIDRFESYMKAIDRGSFLYEVARNRYFNLIEWRQNKIKQDMITSLGSRPIAGKLATLGLKLGGALTPLEISGTAGIANGDKKIRFEILDRMISEAYNTSVDSVIAQSMIDKWVADGERAKDNGEAANGRYPMNFKYKEKFYTYNKQRFSELIKGVNALKSLEAAITQMDYTFMSFPVYCDKPHELITGVSLYDYLNQIKAVDTTIVIESDITTDRDITESNLIDNISGKAAEVMKTIARSHVAGKISLGSLTDDELSLTIDKESDREMLRLLKDRGFNIQIPEEARADNVHDIIFENISNTIHEARRINQLTPTGFLNLSVALSSKQTNDTTGFFMSKIRYLALAIHNIAIYGKLTYDSSANAEANQDAYIIDNNLDQSLDVAQAIQYKDSFTPENIAKMYGKMPTAEVIEELKDSLYFKAWVSYKFYSKAFDGPGIWMQNKMCGIPYIFINRKDKKPSNLWSVVGSYVRSVGRIGAGTDLTVTEFVEDVCSTLVATTNRIRTTDIDTNHPYAFPRSICFGINVKVIIEYILAALECAEENVLDTDRDKKDTNSDSVVNIRLLLKNLKAIETLNTSGNIRDKFSALKTYQDIYNMFFDSVPGVKSDKAEHAFHRFVFIDSIQHLDNRVDDIDEMLWQYQQVTAVAHEILTNPSMYVVEFGGAKHSIVEFVNILSEILALDKKHADEEYFTDSIAMTTIDEKTQRDISSRVLAFVKENEMEFSYDESDTWLDNIIEYCSNNGMCINKSIINSIHLNYERYKINKYGFITLDNKVIHTEVHSGSGSYKAVVTRHGIFGYDGTRVFKLNKIGDFRWLLH